jgi:hypothetical protein
MRRRTIAIALFLAGTLLTTVAITASQLSWESRHPGDHTTIAARLGAPWAR